MKTMVTSHRRTAFYILAALSCLVALVLILGSRNATAEVTLKPMALTGTPLAPLKSSMAILTRPRTRADQNALASVPGVPISSDDDVQLDFGTAVAGADATRPAVLAKTIDADKLCLVTPGALNCIPPSVVQDEGASPSVSWNRYGVQVGVIAQDSVKAVTIVDADGSTRSLDTTGNVAEATLGHLPSQIRWVYRGVTESVSLDGANAVPGSTPAN